MSYLTYLRDTQYQLLVERFLGHEKLHNVDPFDGYDPLAQVVMTLGYNGIFPEGVSNENAYRDVDVPNDIDAEQLLFDTRRSDANIRQMIDETVRWYDDITKPQATAERP